MKNTLKVIIRSASFFTAGVGVALAVQSSADYLASTQNPPCGLDAAIQKALNDKITMIGVTSPDPGKYFNAGSPDSCLGNMSIANLDLSKLIPDPLGLFTGGIDSVIDTLKKAALGAACTAVRNSVGETIYKYNNAIRDINGAVDIRGQTNQFIDTTIADASRKAMDGYAMNWKTPQYSADVTAGVQFTNAPIRLPAVPGVTTPTATPQPAQTPEAGLGASIFGGR